jgi:TolB-like protein
MVANPGSIRDHAAQVTWGLTMAEDGGEEKVSGSTPPVFISYASQDAAVANSIVENLEQHGLRCWLAPRDVKPGAQYADAIVGAINEAKAVVLLLSRNAVASSHVGREVERAASKHKPIIAFRIDAATLSRALEYFLSESQWIDVPEIGMPAALARLAEAAGQASEQTVTANPGAAGRARSRAGGRAKLIAGAVVAVVSVGVASVVGVHFWSRSHKAAQPAAAVAITDKSIAVLPFVDMSAKKDQEYFADGMAEEIINLLTKVPKLKVIGRTSSFQFKGKADDLRRIGTTLGAAYIVEGSVGRSDKHVRVTAQLIDTRDGTYRWSETYDRDVSDVLMVQEEVALGIVRALQLEVASTVFGGSPSAPPPADAYDGYLRGLHARDRFDQRGFEEALAHFRHALQLEPSFSAAAEAAASTLYYMAEETYLPPESGFNQARAAAEAALKLDPGSSVAHAVICIVNTIFDWDWSAAARECAIAARISPNKPFVLRAAAVQHMALGE